MTNFDDKKKNKDYWIEYFRNKTDYIKPSIELIDGTVSEERAALNKLWYFNYFEIVELNELGKGNREFTIKYSKTETEYVTIDYTIIKGNCEFKNVQYNK